VKRTEVARAVWLRKRIGLAGQGSTRGVTVANRGALGIGEGMDI